MSDLSLSADDYLEDFFQDDKTEQKKENSEKKIKIIKVVFFVLCFLLLGEFIIYKYVMPSFSEPKVTIFGAKSMSASEVATKLLTMNSTNWFNFDVNRATSILSSEPIFESVSVEKKFPDKIFINVVERVPVAVTFIVENGRTKPVEIDKNGVIFELKKDFKADSNSIPIISGLPIEYMSSGMRIPQTFRPLIKQISKIQNLPQKYFAGISEICVIPKEYGNYELALIPSQSKIKVLTDRALNEEALKYMMIVLDVLNQVGTDVSEVDLRYGSVSYRMDRGNDGRQ